MNLVNLKNGSSEPSSLVAMTTISLQNLFTDNPLAFYELVQKCKNDNHVIFSSVQKKKLEKLRLLENDKVHQSIKNIVLSSVEGERLEMRLVSPLA